MSGTNFRAPGSDFGLLAIPQLSEWPEMAARNHQLLSQPEIQFGGRSLVELRRSARFSFVECSKIWNPGAGVQSPNALHKDAIWIMTGHQPELYHPGVWAKNFAVAAIAKAANAVGVNLVADTDQLKSTRIKVPSGSLHSNPKTVEVPFDQTDDGRPYETWNIVDEALFDGFAQNLRDALTPDVADPLATEIWPLMKQVQDESGARRISLARQQIEQEWGYGLLESPMSLWADSPVVRHMFCMILADLPRFHAIHDEYLAAYRKEHKIRSRNHPVADLVHKDGWWESPLWVWRDENPTRTSLWVRICENGSGVELRIDGETESIGCLSIRPDRPTDGGVEELARFAAEGIRIRPRALVTTALCRTLLADLFVHGIGGAIYDELGDSIFKTFFGITPPAYAVMSATLRIDDFGPARARDELDVAIRHRRCLEWKAETLGLTDPSVKILLEEKLYWLEQATLEREPRRKRARELRRINREIAVLLAGDLSATNVRIAELRSESAIEQVARSREYSITVHSMVRLRRLAGLIGLQAKNRSPLDKVF